MQMADPDDDVLIITEPSADTAPSRPRKKKSSRKRAVEVRHLPQTSLSTIPQF